MPVAASRVMHLPTHAVLLTALQFVLSACGGPREPAQSSDAVPSQDSVQPARVQSEPTSESQPNGSGEGEAADPLPSDCASVDSPFCVPDRDFVSRLCTDTFPGVALLMFRKGTPWTRGYLTRKTEAWNASGGAAPQGELEFDEEVILLRKRGATGGIQVSGAGGGYDALRWDGSCVTLAEEEVTLKEPPRAKAAKVTWRWIDPELRDAMKEDPELREAYRARRKECKGATMGEVSLQCVKADDGLSRAVEEYVRRGGDLPRPSKLP